MANRIIKCRYWDGEKMIEASTIHMTDNGLQAWDGDKHEYYPLLEWTGLKDKNGKEIYEGDIVKYKNENWVIKWNESEAMFWLRASKCRVEYIDPTEQQVIGNIYENPELLK